MLTMKAQRNLANAEKYFEEHLRIGDYYRKGYRVLGEWFGQAVKDLRLGGVTESEAFVRLCVISFPRRASD